MVDQPHSRTVGGVKTVRVSSSSTTGTEGPVADPPKEEGGARDDPNAPGTVPTTPQAAAPGEQEKQQHDPDKLFEEKDEYDSGDGGADDEGARPSVRERADVPEASRVPAGPRTTSLPDSVSERGLGYGHDSPPHHPAKKEEGRSQGRAGTTDRQSDRLRDAVVKEGRWSQDVERVRDSDRRSGPSEVDYDEEGESEKDDDTERGTRTKRTPPPSNSARKKEGRSADVARVTTENSPAKPKSNSSSRNGGKIEPVVDCLRSLLTSSSEQSGREEGPPVNAVDALCSISDTLSDILIQLRHLSSKLSKG